MPLVHITIAERTRGDFEFLLNMFKIASHEKGVPSDLSWDKIPLIPLRSELHQNASTPRHQQTQFAGLPLVIKRGSYGSAECYVDTYFRLLREDCFGNLKKGIREFQAGKLKNEDLKLWFNVYVMGVHFDRATPGITIALRCKTTGSRQIPKQGSLLCVSCDGGKLKSPIWAIVRNSGETKKNTVTFFVEVVEMKETEFEASRNSTFSTFFQLITFTDDMLFLESPTYFQAYEPVLCSLQTINPKILPFQEEIVHAQWPNIAPDYLMKSTSLDWSCLLKEEGTMVKEIRAGVYDFDKLLQQGFRTFLNDSQKEALQHVLKSRLAMIQGPPGTGKTFLGSKILQLLLSADAFPNQPILIVTYKNQALDQLLEKCVKFFESPGRVVRVGGRSSSQKLEGVNMRDFLSRSKDIFSSDRMQNTKRLEEIQRDMEKLLQEVKTGLSVKIYSSCKWLKLAPEHFIYKLLSRRRNDRYLLQKIPEGESLSEVLLERSLLDSNIYKQLEKAMLENLKEWLPHKGVFRQVRQCFFSLKGLIDLSELDSSTHSEGITRSESGDSEDSDDDKERKQSEMRNGSEKGRINDWLKSNFVNFTIERNDMLFFGLGLEDLDSGLEQNLLFRIDPWKLSQEQRCIAVQLILKRNLEELSRKVHGLKEEYNELCILNEEIDKRRKLDVLKQAKIIGMTTTGAAMHRDIIRTLSPSIVLIEEAAEILEPQIIAVLNPGLQHLILIGDHYQLRPGVECYELEKLHDFGVSMFERLAEHNKLPFQALNMQSRMRDEFLPFLRPIYPALQSNLECVSGSRNQVPTCMMTSMFFWTHSFQEKIHKSPENSGEADMVIALIMWLVAKGNDARTITVIAAYNGQVSLIKKIMKIHPGLHEVEVFTIDKFQGSENQIVIVSLVRSNNECKIGHLNIRNRLCVAVSRARSGLYICGNQKTLSRSPHWRRLIEHFDEQKCLGDIIMLKCPRHPSNPPLRLSSQDAQSFSPNLCKEPCNAYLSDCGHLCVGTCHMGEHVKCDKRVEHVFENCGHSTTKPCHQNPNEMKCNEVISFRFPTCGHTKICKCWELKIRTYLKCLLACTKTLLCGHPCSLSCHEACDLEHCKICEKEERIKAMKEVELAKKEIMEKLQDIDVKLRQLKSNDSDQVVKKELGNHDNVWEYNMVKDRFEKYIQVDHQFYPLIKKIEQVHNLNLRKKFLEAHWEMIDPTKAPQMLFHGTSSEAIDNIIRYGFKLPSKQKKNMYGRGIYFATDSSKSAQRLYTKGSKKLLLCEVLVGNALCVNKSEPELNLKKIRSRYHDSVYSERQSRATGGTLFDEYVVYDCRQAYPSYIISFDQVDIHSANFWPSNPLRHHTDGAAFVRTSLKPSPDLFKNIIDEFHFRIAESQFLRMQSYHGKMKVVEVEVILNRELEARYEQQKQALTGRKDVKERLVFHGTTKEAIEKIIKEGFKVGGEGVEIRCGAAHGRGVYTATNPEISVQYVAGTSMMLLSKAVLGKLGEDYTSVGGNIYVIKKVEQLLPRYIVHYA